MADIPNRTKLEAALARALGKLGAQQLEALVEEIMRTGTADISSDSWARVEAELRGELRPALEQVYRDQAQATFGGMIDWDKINTDAQTWARTYTYDLVKGIVDHERGSVNTQAQQVLQDALAAGWDKGVTVGHLTTALAPTFGPVRAEMIAVTEITRAAAQGEAAVVERLKATGINMSAFWITERDGNVCPICKPRDRHQQGDGWDELPPAHPRCRCSVRWEMQ